MRILLYISALFSLLPVIQVSAQDIHFSQFYNSHVTLNPALTGQFNGDYRFILNQRRQWRSVSNRPFSTIGVGADAREVSRIKNTSAGLSIFNDRTGDSRLNTLQINLTVAYKFQIDSSHALTLGIQPGYYQRNWNNDDLTFNNQYNGTRYDGSLATGETMDRFSFSAPNINLGAAWRYAQTDRKSITLGFSLFNLFNNNQSFGRTNRVDTEKRYVFHAGSSWKLTQDFDIVPNVLFQTQGKFREFVAGTTVKYILDPRAYHYRAIYFGGSLRSRDAGIVALEMDYNTLHVGVSYDVNYSQLDPASRNRGGLEIAIIYILRKIKPVTGRFKNCPDFI